MNLMNKEILFTGDTLSFAEAVSKWNRHYVGEEISGCGVLWWNGKCCQWSVLL